jgi:hypothetical protein
VLSTLQPAFRLGQGLLSAAQSLPAHGRFVPGLGQSAVGTLWAVFLPMSRFQVLDLLFPERVLALSELHLLSSLVYLILGTSLLLLGNLEQRPLSGDTLPEQLSAPSWAHASRGLGCLYHRSYLPYSQSVAGMLLNRQPQPPVGGALQAHQSGLITQADLVIHPAKGGAWIAGARVGHGASRQIAVVDQDIFVAKGQLDLAVYERATDLAQQALQRGHGLARTGLQRAADPAIVCPTLLTPRLGCSEILIQWGSPPTDVLQIDTAAERCDEKLQQLALWRVLPSLLWNRQRLDALHHTDALGVKPPGNEHGVLRERGGFTPRIIWQ